MTNHVRVDCDGAVLVLTLIRPDKRNALTEVMYGVLADGLAEADRDDAVRAVLIRAEGGSFTAGNDLSDFGQDSQSADQPRNLERFLRALATADKPIVAAVQGKAVGVGTTMLLHCDHVILADDAELIVPFVNLGLVPEAGSTWLLPALIGHTRAFTLFAFGDPVSAAEALAWGIANRVVAPAALEAAGRELAARFAARPTGALIATKRLMRDSKRRADTMSAEGDIFRERLRSPEAREAFAAFAQKRAPDFARVTAQAAG